MKIELKEKTQKDIIMYKSISGKQPRAEGEKVEVRLFIDNVDVTMLGTIRGIAAEYPITGFIYIIQFDEPISKTYPYTSYACPETMFR